MNQTFGPYHLLSLAAAVQGLISYGLSYHFALENLDLEMLRMEPGTFCQAYVL